MSEPRAPLNLHIGGTTPKEGWKILNIQPGPHVDFVGNCTNLSQFPDASVAQLYASHVLEHLSYHVEVRPTLAEFHRVLVPGGKIMIGVPDLDILGQLINSPQLEPNAKFFVMRAIYGGQVDAHDYHKSGYNEVILQNYLAYTRFERIRRVESFGLFKDTTEVNVCGVRISLNMEAFKPA